MKKFLRITALVILASLMLLGTACHSLKAPSTPSEIWTPPQWEKSLQAEDPVWTYIRGQDIESSQPLTLMELVDIALCNNPKTQKVFKCDQCDGDPTCVKFCETEALQYVDATSVNLQKSRERAKNLPEVKQKYALTLSQVR